jgi:hypothetical protein
MGRLKPGATYIYERADGVTYAREMGAHPGDRFAIGWDSGAVESGTGTFLGMPIQQVGELVAIAHAAESNPALQDALERVKMLYQLTKQHNEQDLTPGWHPV